MKPCELLGRSHLSNQQLSLFYMNKKSSTTIEKLRHEK
nr:MAG TPA: hypothetical protein [Caudoviricetes sp.]